MLIGISIRGDHLDAPVDLRLGRAQMFLLVDSDTEQFKTLDPGAGQIQHGAGIQTAQMLLKAGVKAVISGDCGPKAFQVFQAAQVPLYSVTGGTAREALAAWRRQELPVIGQPGGMGHA
ncbi:MAG: dinitrogenase iron-molybdenum cofactor biosynthesis protein [Candidatus Riflebacteria bacterium]|nr:dinitrogenase iron-molybdenum cofactor biosynthesis protein [Candidatus Riflebacteria bacterium]